MHEVFAGLDGAVARRIAGQVTFEIRFAMRML